MHFASVQLYTYILYIHVHIHYYSQETLKKRKGPFATRCFFSKILLQVRSTHFGWAITIGGILLKVSSKYIDDSITYWTDSIIPLE